MTWSPFPTCPVEGSDDRQESDSTVAPAARLFDTLRAALGYAADRDYTGWDYVDGISSRILRAVPVENRWINLVFQEGIKRAPVNVRPLLLVEQRRNFMGAGLFAVTHRIFEALGCEDDRFDHAASAVALAEWLVDERCSGYAGFCGGHRHRHQHLDHLTLPSEPDVVTTSYGVKGLLAAAEYDPTFVEAARTAEQFLVEDMNYREVGDGAKIDYYPKDTADHYTLNAGAVAAGALLDLYDHVGADRLHERATALLDYVATRQTDAGGWYYRDPPSASHLSMDTHHNGFIIEAFQRHRAVTGSPRYDDTLADALSFFRRSLFEDDGAPTFDERSRYPRDVHAAAQGILVFSRAGELGFARRILEWTIDNLYAGEGRFYFRKHRLYTQRVTLMRWCQAWMCFALGTYLVVASEDLGDGLRW